MCNLFRFLPTYWVKSEERRTMMKIFKSIKQRAATLTKCAAALLTLALLCGLTGCKAKDHTAELGPGAPEDNYVSGADHVENRYSIGRAAQIEADADFRFITALIETAMILHESPYLGDIGFSQVLELLNTLDLSGDPARAEFRTLIAKLVQ
jgi:hypothetical protein